MEWKGGKLVQAEIRNVSSPDGQCVIRYADKKKALAIQPSAGRVLAADEF